MMMTFLENYTSQFLGKINDLHSTYTPQDVRCWVDDAIYLSDETPRSKQNNLIKLLELKFDKKLWDNIINYDIADIHELVDDIHLFWTEENIRSSSKNN